MMKKNIKILLVDFWGIFFLFTVLACTETAVGNEPEGTLPPIDIPPGKVTVATYYFPNWGLVASSEWSLLQKATPKFANHQQPKVPLWGYQNENDPTVMEKKIDAASAHGIDAFIFDWYYYDDDERMPGSKYLFHALEEGYLKAMNNSKIKFSLLWCNHDLGDISLGAVKPETFEALTDYVIKTYFKHPSYWLIDGCPYFSIYEVNTFVKSFGGDYAKAGQAIERFREKVKAAGFPDLHLNCVIYGMGGNLNLFKEALHYQSATSYVWIHHNALPDFPATEYVKAGEAYMQSVKQGGGANGLEKGAVGIPAPYHINVSMGWDSSPRCGAVSKETWMSNRVYPFGAVIKNNTPYLFKKFLAEAKEMTMKKPETERVIVINSWNEWGEGSYLEPDRINKMEYLEAVRDVFVSK